MEDVELLLVLAQALDILVDVAGPGQRQAPVDSPAHCARLVVGEVDAKLLLQDAGDRLEPRRLDRSSSGSPARTMTMNMNMTSIRERSVTVTVTLIRFGLLLPIHRVLQESGRHVLRRQHPLGHPDRPCCLGHAVELSAGGVLHHHQPARIVDIPNPPRTIAPTARQHDGHRARAAVSRQRAKEDVDGQARVRVPGDQVRRG